MTIRFLIIALPVGLLLTGIASMVIVHLRAEGPRIDPNESIRMEAASLSRKPVNQPDVERFLEVLAGTIGERNTGAPDQLERAAVWIESTLAGANMGYRVERQVYSAGGHEVRNLAAELPGHTRREEIVVIGAHYDTVPGSPGANDNGSGVAALLAVARAFAGDPQERTVRFVFFVNEEPPWFHTEEMGSRVYARRSESRGEKIVAMLALDTIGYFSDEAGSQDYPPGLEKAFPPTGNFLAFVANEPSRYLADSARAAFRGETDIPALAGAFPEEVSGVSWSDHWSFWQSGYPGVMVTDTAPYRYPHYHKPSDTADKIDPAALTTVAQGLKAVVEAWANP